MFKDLEDELKAVIKSVVHNECDKYILESSDFYDLVLASGFQRLIEPFISSLIGVLTSGQVGNLAEEVYRLLGIDSGTQPEVKRVTEKILSLGYQHYKGDNPLPKNDGTFSLYQFRQELEPDWNGDYRKVAQQKPVIPRLDERKQGIINLLEQDFGYKVYKTLKEDFRRTIHPTLKEKFLLMSEDFKKLIGQQWLESSKRLRLEQIAESRAEEQLNSYTIRQSELKKKILTYNDAIDDIKQCLQTLRGHSHQLHRIEDLG